MGETKGSRQSRKKYGNFSNFLNENLFAIFAEKKIIHYNSFMFFFKFQINSLDIDFHQ